MVGPNFKEPSTEWQASQAIFVNRSKPFDSGELAANELGLFEFPQPDIKRKIASRMMQNLICKESMRIGDGNFISPAISRRSYSPKCS